MPIEFKQYHKDYGENQIILKCHINQNGQQSFKRRIPTELISSRYL